MTWKPWMEIAGWYREDLFSLRLLLVWVSFVPWILAKICRSQDSTVICSQGCWGFRKSCAISNVFCECLGWLLYLWYVGFWGSRKCTQVIYYPMQKMNFFRVPCVDSFKLLRHYHYLSRQLIFPPSKFAGYLEEAYPSSEKITGAMNFGTNISNLNYCRSNGVCWPRFILKLLDFLPKSYIVIMMGMILFDSLSISKFMDGEVGENSWVIIFFFSTTHKMLNNTTEMHNYWIK